jgi:hypothetical protein
VEERYLSEIKTLQVELVGLRQKEGETMLVLNKQASQEQRVRSQEMLREKAEHEEKVLLERTLAKNTSTLQHHREQLFKVWSAMQTDPVDKIDFLTQVMELAPYSDKLLHHMQSYSTRLAAQLPMLQQVTRREFIKYRLKCIHRFQQDPSKRQVRDVFIVHVGGTRCVPFSTDHTMHIHARITWGVECIRTCLFLIFSGMCKYNDEYDQYSPFFRFDWQEFAAGTEGERTRDLLMSELNVLNNKLQHSLQVRGWW